MGIATLARCVLFLAVSLALVISVAAHRDLSEDRVGSAIMGGQDAPRGRFRYMASLRSAVQPDSHGCGGFLIHPRIVLTAAHCVINTQTLEPKPDHQFRPLVRIGGHTLNSDPPRFYHLRRTVRTIVHPKFAGGESPPDDYMNNDVALLLLNKPSTMPTVQVAAGKIKPDNPYPDHTPLIALGWGVAVSTPVIEWPENLQMLDVTLMPLSVCQSQYGSLVWQSFWGAFELVNYNWTSNTMICAAKGYPHARADACSGDSGGPLIVPRSSCSREDVAAGMVSWGDACVRGAAGMNPGVYTDLTMVQPWIAATVKRLTNSTLPLPTPSTCTARVYGGALVRGFNGGAFNYTGTPGAVNIFGAPGLRLNGVLRNVSTSNSTALGSIVLAFRDVVRAQAVGQEMRVSVNRLAFAANTTATVANNGSVTFEPTQPRNTHRLTVQQPGATVTIEQRFVKKTGTYSGWLDVSVTLKIAPLTPLSGVLGETFKPSVHITQAAAPPAGRASKFTASFTVPP